MSSKTKISSKKVGQGGDGFEYAVSTKTTSGDKYHYRRKPCATCPWRKDAETGRFPAEAFRTSANTAIDGSTHAFACHESGVEKSATCAGFLLANSQHNIGVRLALAKGRLDIDKVGNPEDVPLYESYRSMAIANGVDPDDPAIALCRSNDGINDVK